jgi:membrane-bound inhibitor of C-type lysozyme
MLAWLAFIGSVTSALAADVVYRCADGTVLRAGFRGLEQHGSVRLTFPGLGHAMTLPQRLASDGGRYTDGNTEFWIRGTTAQLTRAGSATACETVRPK